MRYTKLKKMEKIACQLSINILPKTQAVIERIMRSANAEVCGRMFRHKHFVCIYIYTYIYTKASFSTLVISCPSKVY